MTHSAAKFRKLVIQIPCFNEESVLAATLAELPRHVDGFERVEWLVIDDGSRDGTASVARRCGVDHIVRLTHNQGLARAFMIGLEACLKVGADVIVNTDADNQYRACSIPDLVAPILTGEAQIVVGARPIGEIDDFSFAKKALQRIGSSVVRLASGTSIPDAPSGFRAIQSDAALRLCVFGEYTYTLETIIQAGRKNIPICSVPVQVNGPTRPSRLVKSTPSYVYLSILNILRIFTIYKPLRFFVSVAVVLAIPGILLGMRYLYYWASGAGGGKVQSLVLAAILIVSSIVVLAAGMLADLSAANRVLLEDLRMRLLSADIRAARSALRDTKAGEMASSSTAGPGS